LKVKGNPFVSG